jgi:hypothetical protein
MLAYAVMALLTALIVVISAISGPPAAHLAGARDQAVAYNFVTYRNAVIEYAQTDPAHGGAKSVGEIALKASLPPNWRALSTWHNRIKDGRVLVWGEVPRGAMGAIEGASKNTVAIGRTQSIGGTEYIVATTTGARLPIPGGVVPVGVAASVVELN